MKKHEKEAPSSMPSAQNTTQAAPAPYIKEIVADSSKFPMKIANEGFTIVLPAINNETYLMVLFDVIHRDGKPYLVTMMPVPITNGVETVYTVLKEHIAFKFKVGDDVKIRPVIRLTTGEWIPGHVSKPYIIV